MIPTTIPTSSPKFFPIKTKTACQLKWNWSTIRLYDGTTSSCHRVTPDEITVENFDTFHNTPKKLSDRNLMLQGLWPQGGCEYCKDIEDAGGSSDRMFHLKIPDMTPLELDSDPSATVVSPKIVEVYMDNVCNMACLYCWDGFSSRIQQENVRFGRFENQGVIIDNQAKLTDNRTQLNQKFWEWMISHGSTINRLHILGGEPFFQSQFENCLSFLENNACPNLEFNVISNLKIETTKLQKIIERIKNILDCGHIKRFDLTASIDCFGPEQEYVRYGLDLDQWRQNFQMLIDHPWILLNVNQTLSALTIKTVPDFLIWFNNLRRNREIGHYFSTVVMTHEFLHPGIFGSKFYSQDFESILAEMPSDTWQQKQARLYMQGIQLQIGTCQRDPVKIKQLAIFLDEIDRRRSLDWKRVFPWLKKEVDNVV